ncbi:hypothetical protein NDU88_004723 [Pleurodeles waltl]|uniref:Uncharacterized protein n=1 Tax=Pleurodeles waltl TaxID=8319 RepID=A0AAV7NK94_PLEWA|nr:hypothetical protein NDU88_004723 [Pleurodeles waltl]
MSCPQHLKKKKKKNLTGTSPVRRAKEKPRNEWPGRRSAVCGRGAPRPALMSWFLIFLHIFSSLLCEVKHGRDVESHPGSYFCCTKFRASGWNAEPS